LPLSWLNELLLQKVQLDTPETERLHDGTSISCAMSEVDVCAAHQRDGLPHPQTLAVRELRLAA
jgi:hypothetical protein